MWLLALWITALEASQQEIEELPEFALKENISASNIPVKAKVKKALDIHMERIDGKTKKPLCSENLLATS